MNPSNFDQAFWEINVSAPSKVQSALVLILQPSQYVRLYSPLSLSRPSRGGADL
jgi:hypothetical protein